MPVFSSSEMLIKVLRALFDRIGEDPQAIEEVSKTRLIYRLSFSSPRAALIINAKNNPLTIRYSETGNRANIEVQMPADMFHGILLGELKMKKAIASGKFKVKGPVWKAFVLEGIFYRGQSIYPEVLNENGIEI